MHENGISMSLAENFRGKLSVGPMLATKSIVFITSIKYGFVLS